MSIEAQQGDEAAFWMTLPRHILEDDALAMFRENKQLRQQLADATQRAEKAEQERDERAGAAIANRNAMNIHRNRAAELEGLLRERPEPEDVHDCCGSGFMCMGGRQPSKEYKDWSAKVDAAIAPSPAAKGDDWQQRACGNIQALMQPDAERPDEARELRRKHLAAKYAAAEAMANCPHGVPVDVSGVSCAACAERPSDVDWGGVEEIIQSVATNIDENDAATLYGLVRHAKKLEVDLAAETANADDGADIIQELREKLDAAKIVHEEHAAQLRRDLNHWRERAEAAEQKLYSMTEKCLSLEATIADLQCALFYLEAGGEREVVYEVDTLCENGRWERDEDYCNTEAGAWSKAKSHESRYGEGTARIIEVTEIRRVLSGAGEEGSK